MSPGAITRLAGGALVAYVCWRILSPFLPALCWAFALALIATPVCDFMRARKVPPNLAAAATVLLSAATVGIPLGLLAGALARETADLTDRLKDDHSWLAPALGWLDARFDVSKEAAQLVRSAAGWASVVLSSILKGSAWLITQLGVALFVAFYFIRDGASIVSRLRAVVPLPEATADRLFARITQTIRVSLAGKIVVACLQGTLGGLMFFWLGLPAPVFWGAIMAMFSVVPVLGAFMIWVPAAIAMAVQNDWKDALLLTAWGIAIIHPVDNILGPILVGKTLRVHTLFMFFSVIGGIAAFGATGIVLGPVAMAVVTVLLESHDHSSDVGAHTAQRMQLTGGR